MKRTTILSVLLAAAWGASKAEMCTRVVYTGPEETVLTVRTMDWKEDPQSKLWIFPRGIRRNGAAGANSLEWTSKFGSAITSAYDICTTDGMNEKGLAANLLWLAESEYPTRDSRKPALSVSVWAQYVLDNFATVDEAVAAFSSGEFDVISDLMPDDSGIAALHLSVSDASGDSAIFEYIDGRLAIRHSPEYTVMTNSPTFDKQLALDDYWDSIGGLVFLPVTNRAADRFVRASFYVGTIPKTADTRLAVASVFSVIRNVSVPLGISTPDEPNISSTRWRTVADQKNRVYYYESVLYPFLIWVDFDELDFSAGAPVRMIDPAAGKRYAGDTTSEFVPAAPFIFQTAN